MPIHKQYVEDNPNRERFNTSVESTVNDMEGITVKAKTPASADTEFIVRHKLGRKPKEFSVCCRKTGGTLYESNESKRSKTIMAFKYSAGADEITIRLR